MGTDSPVCSLGITTISPGVNTLRLHGWRHPLLSYLPLVLFFHSASQPFSWCWCGPDTVSHELSTGIFSSSCLMYSKILELARKLSHIVSLRVKGSSNINILSQNKPHGYTDNMIVYPVNISIHSQSTYTGSAIWHHQTT